MGKCHFRSEWLQKKDDLGFFISKWAKKGSKDDELFCIVCDSSVKVTKGYQAVIQHYKGKKHIQNARTKLGISQCHLIISNADLPSCVPSCSTSNSENLPNSTSTPALVDTSVAVSSENTPFHEEKKQGILQFFSARDFASRAEIVWSMVVITKNFSAQSCEGMGAIFRFMFPGLVPEGFSISPKKLSYIVTHALGPYFRDIMLKEAQKEFFSVQFDETTNNKGKKELQINIKYWSSTKDEIVSHHLQTIFIGSATAEVLKTSILSALDKASLSLKNLVSIGSDGPAVNQKVFRLLNEEAIAVREKSLLSVGTCNLHHVNNAFLKGLEAFGIDVADLVIAVYYFFHGWPSRQEEYAESQKKKQVPQNVFIKHVPTRWLSLKASASRLLEQWPAIRHYFLEFLPKFKSIQSISSYSKIASLLKKKTMKAQLLFILTSSEIFVKFSTLFQKEEPLIHILQQELDTLLLTLVGRVCKRLNNMEDLAKDAFESQNLLSPKEVECGSEVEEEIQTLSERDQLEFRIGAREHYAACGRYLLKKSDKMLKLFSCLQPAHIASPSSCKHVLELSKSLPGEISVDILLDEWRLLQIDSALKYLTQGLRIDHFWRQIFVVKNSLGGLKYPSIQKFVKICLSIYHGSADVERGFSLSTRILTGGRAAMTEMVLNAKLNVIDGLKIYDNNPIQVPITRELLNLAQNAHQSYMLYCAEQKRKEENIKKKEAEEKKRVAEEEATQIIAKKMKTDIESMVVDLKELRKKYQEKKEIRENLFEEANKRLKTAVTKNNLKEVNLAQAMMEGIEHIKFEETELQEKVLNLEKALDKKTSSLISKFVKK